MDLFFAKLESLFKKMLPIERYLFRHITSRLHLSLSYAENKEGTKILEDIFIKKEYAPYFPFYESATIIDIGAYYGFFSLFAAMNTHPDSKILAFEPASQNYKTLRKNIQSNRFSNISCFKQAVSDTSGTAPLFLSRSYNHSLLGGKEESLSETVPTISLKDIMEEHKLEKVDFLKIDCEGGEYPILLSTEEAVLKKITTISMEFHDTKAPKHTPLALASHLEKCGFRIIKLQYDPDYSATNQNYGKLLATK